MRIFFRRTHHCRNLEGLPSLPGDNHTILHYFRVAGDGEGEGEGEGGEGGKGGAGGGEGGGAGGGEGGGAGGGEGGGEGGGAGNGEGGGAGNGDNEEEGDEEEEGDYPDYIPDWDEEEEEFDKVEILSQIQIDLEREAAIKANGLSEKSQATPQLITATGVKKPAGTAEEVEKHFGCTSSELIMVGDRPFTDIVSGNINGFLTVLTEPLCRAQEPFIVRQMRRLELALLKRWLRKGVKPVDHSLVSNVTQFVMVPSDL